MGKYNRLVVAMDGSLASQNALKQAFKLAQDEKRWITVVAINPPYQGDLDLVGVSNIAEILKGPGEKILAEAKEIAEKEGVTIRTRLEEGEPFEKIIDVAEDEGSDLIVMGRRGITRLEKALMGSVTAKVIGHFSGRVLIVPRDTTLGWEHILVASDGSRYGDAAVSEAINYAKSYGGSLTIVSAIDVTEEFQALAPDTVDKMIEKAKKHLESDQKKAEEEGVSAETYVREGES